MAKLNAREVNVLKALIEGGAGESLYNRLDWNTPKNVRFSQEEKAVLYWHRDENEYTDSEDKALLNKILGV